MADSILGDIGSTVGDATHNAASAVADAVAHAEVDISAATSGLSQFAGNQVIEAAHDLGHAPTQEEVDTLVHHAEEADAHRIEAEAQQHLQAKAAEDGDYAKAHEVAQNAQYELHAAADNGASLDHHIMVGEKEVASLDNANWQQQIAHEAAHDAASYANAGDDHAAANYAHTADDHASTAADYGHAGDHGGTTASHDSSADSHDASAASE